jgi:GNAT superfamily N-acetyltransferase
MSNNTVSNLKNDDMAGTVDQSSIHYRILADEEMQRLAPLFFKLSWDMPDPDKSKILVCEAGEGDDALILGFAVIQFVAHAEPFWVHPDMRGSGIAEDLMGHIVHYVENDCKLGKYIAIAKPGSFGARLCEANGMTPFPGQVYVKQIGRKVKVV